MFAVSPFGWIRRQKHVADAVFSETRQFDAQIAKRCREKIVRHLQQNAGAIAGQWIATTGATMGEIHENLQALTHDLVALFAVHVDDEAHAASIVLEGRIVQAFTLAWIEWKVRLHLVHRALILCSIWHLARGPMQFRHLFGTSSPRGLAPGLTRD